MNKILMNEKVSIFGKTAYLLFAELKDENNEIEVTVKDMARRMSVSRPSVYKAISELQDVGALDVIREKGSRTKYILRDV